MSILSAIAKPIVSAAVNTLGGEMASPTTQQFRLAQCNACPFMKNETMSCGTPWFGGTVTYDGKEQQLCGCFVEDKSKLKNQACPLGKW